MRRSRVPLSTDSDDRWEAYLLGLAGDAFAAGRMSLTEFERRVEAVLTNLAAEKLALLGPGEGEQY